jgi:hypothetical protein
MQKTLLSRLYRVMCLGGVALISLASCSMADATLTYAGTMRPVSGTCDPQSQAALTLRKTDIVFAPASGTLELRGQLNNQSVSALLDLTDPNKHAYHLRFEGIRSGKEIAGIYTTPRCRYAVTLHLTGD